MWRLGIGVGCEEWQQGVGGDDTDGLAQREQTLGVQLAADVRRGNAI